MESDGSNELLNNNESKASTTQGNQSPNETLQNCQNVEEESLRRNDEDQQPEDCSSKKNVLQNSWDYAKPIAIYAETIYSLSVALLKFTDDVIAAKSYSESAQAGYLMVTLFCLIGPSLMFSIYMVAKYIKNNVQENASTHISTVIILFIKNFLFFLPLKFSCFWAILKHLVNNNQKHCCQKMSEESSEQIKELKADARIISFFQRFFAGFPQIVLQLYISMISNETEIDYFLVYSQFVLSGLSLNSLCASVNREDDGILSTILTRIGWISTIFSRCLLFAILTSLISNWIVFVCAIHILLVTLYLTLLADQSNIRYLDKQLNDEAREKLKTSSFFVILTTFGFQSLVYWPTMFALAAKHRPLKYFGLIVTENVAIIVSALIIKMDYFKAVSAMSSIVASPFVFSVLLASIFTIVGVAFVFLYLLWKPACTEMWTLFLDNEEGRNVHPITYGVYYEYFGVAFTIPVHIPPDEQEEFSDRFGVLE